MGHELPRQDAPHAWRGNVLPHVGHSDCPDHRPTAPFRERIIASPTTHSAKIAHDLRALGVRPGGVLLVHSSLRSLGPVPGGAETVIQGLLAAVGEEGTLLLPALSYQHVNSQTPLFDAVETPSNVGALPEYFRTRPGTQRSVHPTHSVCSVGPRAEVLLADHWCDETPCGRFSPFRKLREIGGQLLMLGCGLCPNTSMHAIEELIVPPYLFGPEVDFRLRLADHIEYEKTYRTHGFVGYKQRYERLAEYMPSRALRVGPCLRATGHLFDVPVMWETALREYRRDPLAFAEREVAW